MVTKDPLYKDMMLKLKKSFSLKNFSSKSYESSLICNSKTIHLDFNLITGIASTSDKSFSSSNFTSKSPRIVSKKNEKYKSCCDQIVDNFVSEKESRNSSSSKIKSTKSDRNEEFLINEDLPTENEKLKLKISVKHSHQANSLNQVETAVKPSCSGFQSLRCDVCMKYFSSQRSVKRHGVLHSLERHACGTCDKVFRTKETLKRHCKVVHEVKVKSIKCSKCTKVFSRKADSIIHFRKHPDHVQ